MGRFGFLARRYLLDRALGGRRAYGQYPSPYHSPYPSRYHGRRSPGRFGWWGPIPRYSTRTRHGTEVSVGGCGCCLPIPLVVVLSTAAGLRALWRRLR